MRKNDAMMKIARYYSNKDVRLDEMPKPTIGPKEFLVKVKRSGICGSDIIVIKILDSMKCLNRLLNLKNFL